MLLVDNLASTRRGDQDASDSRNLRHCRVLGLGSLSTLAGRETIRTFAITAAWRFAAALGIIVRPERVLIEAIADFGVLWYRSEQQTKM